jgi:trehalose 6-phosphate synthase
VQILSYRGPSAPGGVSSAVTQIFEQESNSSEWWFIDGERLICRNAEGDDANYVLDSILVENHYKYCNNFLWPVLHDLPQFAHYSEQERLCYKAFNSGIAFRLRNIDKDANAFFVNDYQFALMPNLLKHSTESFVFWHIPWPKYVRPEHVDAMAELATGLLHANVVGFHTEEYRQNFFNFVTDHMHQFNVQTSDHTIKLIDRTSYKSHSTKFVSAPLGIDSEHWSDLANLGSLRQQALTPPGMPIILSVDRADYTKGVAERFTAIDCFFEKYPQWQKKVSFLQLGTRSRQGLPEFDRYWQNCQERYTALNSHRATGSWQPLVWTDLPRTGGELASLYSKAAVMLVSPVRDGLNLTAKEYVACQKSHPGVLGLSRGAGAFNELRSGCVELDPHNPAAFAHAIAQCLTMSDKEKSTRTYAMKESLAANSLENWWQSFAQQCRMTQSKSKSKLDRQVGSIQERICS